MADLAEIEGATSGRLNHEARGGDRLAAGEMVTGLPHAELINAAFAYWRPLELNRFNGPGRGAWYARRADVHRGSQISYDARARARE